MTLKKSILHFEHYLAGQQKAIDAIKSLVSIDSVIATAAFDLTLNDLNALCTTTSPTIKRSAKRNSQLFYLSPPPEEKLKKILEVKPINTLYFASAKIKSCITSYIEAQRNCVLCIKAIYDDNPKIAGALFNLDDTSSAFIQDKNTCELADIADRYAWLIKLNSYNNKSLLMASIERSNFDISFVESSLVY